MAEQDVKAKPNVEETGKQVIGVVPRYGVFGVGELHPTIEKYYKKNPEVAEEMRKFFESERKPAEKGGGKSKRKSKKGKSKKKKSKKRKSKRKQSRKSRKRSKRSKRR